MTAIFPRVSLEDEGGWRRFRTIACKTCGFVGRWRDATANGAPSEMITHGLRRMGWTVKSPGEGLCPKCVSAKGGGGRSKPDLTSGQRRAAYLRMKAVEEAAAKPEIGKPSILPTLETPTMNAKPPPAALTPAEAREALRQPTREDRRRILDALDAHYQPEAGRYAKAFSDATVAAKLDVPRAWVAEERDRAFGPDVNEAGAEAELKWRADLTKRCEALETQAMALAAQAETLRLELAKPKSLKVA